MVRRLEMSSVMIDSQDVKAKAGDVAVLVANNAVLFSARDGILRKTSQTGKMIGMTTSRGIIVIARRTTRGEAKEDGSEAARTRNGKSPRRVGQRRL